MNSASEDNEYFEEDKYVMAPEDKQEVNDYIAKRKYERHQPKKPRSEAQNKAFEKARAKLIENKAKKNVAQLRKSVPVTAKNKTSIIKQAPKTAAPKKEVKQYKSRSEPVYDGDYEDDAQEEQFMISNNNKDYIVRPVIRRLAQAKTSITVKKRKPIKKEQIENNIDKQKLDNIVETQINHNQAQKKPAPTQPHYVNVYQHKDAIKESTANKRSRSLLDDF